MLMVVYNYTSHNALVNQSWNLYNNKIISTYVIKLLYSHNTAISEPNLVNQSIRRILNKYLNVIRRWYYVK